MNKNLCYFILITCFICNICLLSQTRIIANGITKRDAYRNALSEYLNKIMDISVLNEMPDLNVLKGSMLKDTTCFIKTDQTKLKKIEGKFQGEVIINVKAVLSRIVLQNVIPKIFNRNIAIIATIPKLENKAYIIGTFLRCSCGFSLMELYDDQKNELRKVYKFKKKLAQWMDKNRIHVVLEFSKNRGRAWNVVGRSLGSFSCDDKWIILEHLLKQILKWRVAQEYFLTFNNFPDSQQIQNLLDQYLYPGQYRPISLTNKKYKVDILTKNSRNKIIKILQKELPNHQCNFIGNDINYTYIDPNNYVWLYAVPLLLVIALLVWKKSYIFLHKTEKSKPHLKKKKPAGNFHWLLGASDNNEDWMIDISDNDCPICNNLISVDNWKPEQVVWAEGKFYHIDCLQKNSKVNEMVDDWKLIVPIGENSFGSFFLAEHKNYGIKLIHRLPSVMEHHNDKQQWPRMMQRFERAQELIAKLSGTYILKPDTLHKSKDGKWYYYTMPYKPVWTLRQILQNSLEESLPYKKVLPVLFWLSKVLALLHKNNLIHRDIKPAHILCQKDGTLLLTGFFLLKHSKFKEETSQSGSASDTMTSDINCNRYDNNSEDYNYSSVTLTGEKKFVGTPSYVSPEQLCDSAKVQGKTDVWSWAVLAYELLTGDNPFNQGGVWNSLNAVNRFQTFSEHAGKLPPDVPKQMIDIFYETMEKNVDKRISSGCLVQKLEKLDWNF